MKKNPHHVRIKEEVGELVWSRNTLGKYTPWIGYKSMLVFKRLEDTQWWWKPPWKIKSLMKSIIFMWLDILNKGPYMGISLEEKHARA
jgi:hypothetical protein